MNQQIITSCGSRGLHLLAERVEGDKWAVYLSMEHEGSWRPDIMEFHVELPTVPQSHVPAQALALVQISTDASLRMQKLMPCCNARTLREYILATLLVVRAYNVPSCSSIQVALGLSLEKSIPTQKPESYGEN